MMSRELCDHLFGLHEARLLQPWNVAYSRKDLEHYDYVVDGDDDACNADNDLVHDDDNIDNGDVVEDDIEGGDNDDVDDDGDNGNVDKAKFCFLAQNVSDDIVLCNSQCVWSMFTQAISDMSLQLAS